MARLLLFCFLALATSAMARPLRNSSAAVERSALDQSTLTSATANTPTPPLDPPAESVEQARRTAGATESAEKQHSSSSSSSSSPPPSPSELENGEKRGAAADAPEQQEKKSHKKKKRRDVDKSIAGGEIILGGLATAIFAAVFCYIRVTRRRNQEENKTFPVTTDHDEIKS